MSVIAIVNRKGGVGKSTLATHVAGYLATQGHSVMLGDIDRQQSSRLWLGLRPKACPPIAGWTADERNFVRPPAGADHIVLDTPGGFQGMGLMRVALYADAIVIPVGHSLFDRAAVEASLKELRSLPRIANGKCRLACIGMRIDGRTRNAASLKAWARGQELHWLGTIKATQTYNRCLEQGLSLFDFPAAKVAPYLAEWQALIHWLAETIDEPATSPHLTRPIDHPVSRGAFDAEPPRFLQAGALVR